jgi:N-acetylmuramoyl-L-alanine amidase
MQILNHLLYSTPNDQVEFQRTPNFGKPIRPIYLIIHYTAGTTAAGTIEWFKNPKSKASAHLILDRDGAVTQMVPFNRRAWHAGQSRWGELTDLNNYSIGIELVNAGKLRQRSDGAWLSWAKQRIPDDQVTLASHKNEEVVTGWHEYTDAQITATVELGMILAERYGLVDVLGHDDVAPTRKIDPGPLFPMSSIRSRILGREV